MDINAAMTTATTGMINSLGLSATYTPLLGATQYITCLFDRDYKELDLVSGAVSTFDAAAHCKTADVGSAKKGDAMTVSGTAYTVTTVKPDGTGLTTLLLKKT